MSNNIVNLFLDNAIKYPDKIAIASINNALTYADLADKVRNFAGLLLAKNIKKGDRILVMTGASTDLYVILLAIFYIGATCIFVDPLRLRKHMDQILNNADCKALITNHLYYIPVMLYKSIRNIPVKLFANCISQITNADIDPEIAEVKDTDTALVVYTSGTTGQPKAADRTHRFLREQHKALDLYIKIHPDEVDMNIYPVYMLHNLASGASTIMTGFKPASAKLFNPDRVFSQIEKYQVSRITASPAFCHKLALYSKQRGVPESLKKLVIGGAPLYKSQTMAIQKVFGNQDILIAYGSTEVEPVSVISFDYYQSFLNNTDVTAIPAGRPVETLDIRIIDTEKFFLDAETVSDFDYSASGEGQAGEIVVSGPHVLENYYNMPYSQGYSMFKVQGKNWLRTGDRGYFDQDGNLFLTGRVSNCFVCKGRLMDVYQVERVLEEVEGVNAGTVIEIDGSLILVIEKDSEGRMNIDALKEKLSEIDLHYDYLLFEKVLPKDLRHASRIDYERLINKYKTKLPSKGN